MDLTIGANQTLRSRRAGRPGLATSRRLVAAVAIGLGLSQAASAQNDSVQTKDGKTLSGKIQAETYDNLEIQARAGVAAQKVPWENVHVATIKYGAPPAEFTEALDKLAKGNVEEALAAWTGLKGDNKLAKQQPLRQQVLLHIASLQQRLGKYDDAIATWQELLGKEFINGRYLDQAAGGVVECNLAKGSPDAASKALDQIVADAKAAGVGPRFQNTTALLKANILEKQKKYTEARA